MKWNYIDDAGNQMGLITKPKVEADVGAPVRTTAEEKKPEMQAELDAQTADEAADEAIYALFGRKEAKTPTEDAPVASEPVEPTREPRPLIRLLKALVCMAAGIAVAVLLVTQAISIFQVMCRGVTTSARVFECHDEEVDGPNGRSGIMHVEQYEFFVQGARFGGARRGDCFIGDMIDIKYNPKNPAQNEANGDSTLLNDYFTMLLLGGSFSYLTIKFSFPILRRSYRRRHPSNLDARRAYQP